MYSDNENIWYVLFAANGKAAKMRPYLEIANIEYFYPMCLKERKMIDTERKRLIVQPLLGNLLFVKSSRERLDPFLYDVKLSLAIASNLYYRDTNTKQLITIPEDQMRNFISVASSKHKQVIYLTNGAVNFQTGTRVRVTGGVFEGIEGVIMRSKGKNRVVVIIPNLLSVATAFIPPCFILPIE
jgi:transcription antitermination factor NusG